MKRFLIASTALALSAAPVHAQLLGGGGGLGGGLGGAVGGTLGGVGPIGSTGGIGNATRGTLEGTGGVRGSARADRHSGRVDADGNGSGGLTGDLGGTLNGPPGSTGVDGRASGSASGGGSASAQLIGTDTVRSTTTSAIGQAHGTAQGAVAQGQGAAQGFVGAASGVAGNAQGNASGAAAGAGSVAGGSLAAAGSFASQANGAFAIERGTPIFAPDGDKIGRVRQVVRDARGNVQQLLVKVDGEEATLPANYFQASGSGLISVIGEGQIRRIAEQQDAADNQ